MNKSGLIIAVLCLLLPNGQRLSAETVSDRLIGTVTLRNNDKLDTKSKQELVNIASRIKKNRERGIIRVVGDFPSARSQDEYIEKSVFMARTVEMQLTTLLAGKYQVYVAATQRSGAMKNGQNSVAIRFYPHELVEMEEGSTSIQAVPQEISPPSGTVYKLQPSPSAAPQPLQSGLLTPPPEEDGRFVVTSKKERIKQESEDPVRANELVNRAKARAAARAKQLERER